MQRVDSIKIVNKCLKYLVLNIRVLHSLLRPSDSIETLFLRNTFSTLPRETGSGAAMMPNPINRIFPDEIRQ